MGGGGPEGGKLGGDGGHERRTLVHELNGDGMALRLQEKATGALLLPVQPIHRLGGVHGTAKLRLVAPPPPSPSESESKNPSRVDMSILRMGERDQLVSGNCRFLGCTMANLPRTEMENWIWFVSSEYPTSDQ